MKKTFLPILIASLFLLTPLTSCKDDSEPITSDLPTLSLPNEPIEQVPSPLAPDEQNNIEIEVPNDTPSTPTTPDMPTTPDTTDTPTTTDSPQEPSSESNESPKVEEESPPIIVTQPVAENKTEYIQILYTGLNIRSGPSTSYSSYGTIEKDTFFPYLGTENGWYKTLYKGKTAYVSSNKIYTALIKMPKASATVEKVIQKGTECIGVKYVYGAIRLHDGKGHLNTNFTKTEFDCSSLIQYIFYYGANVKLDVTTRTQVVQGKKVARSDLKRGDCIYFTNSSRVNKTGIERVGHVALYLGDGYILHTASDYCKIEKMTQARWNYYIEARRFI